MKLLSKTTSYFLLMMLPILAGGGVYFFKQFDKQLKKETDEELENDRRQWIRYLADKTINITDLYNPETSIEAADQPAEAHPHLHTVMRYQEVDQKEVPFRELKQVITIRGNNYLLTIRKSLIEKNDLIGNITLVMAIAFAGLLLFTLLVNWLISRSIWQPFYHSLNQVETMQLDQMNAVTFPSAPVHEFNRLNDALNSMTARIYHDFINMKELTEDAAHEMQTPLAIAQNKLELLLQDEGLQDHQLQAIAGTHEALLRLSMLNRNMLFMAKIGNNQFSQSSQVSMQAVIEKQLSLFDELIKDKQLSITTHFTCDYCLQLHPILADTLISNLLGNAIKYNRPQGTITIELSNQQLLISNTSQFPAIPSDQLFRRFKKTDIIVDGSNGLGLAIVKKIVDTNHLHIDYNYTPYTHTFMIQTIRKVRSSSL